MLLSAPDLRYGDGKDWALLVSIAGQWVSFSYTDEGEDGVASVLTAPKLFPRATKED